MKQDLVCKTVSDSGKKEMKGNRNEQNGKGRRNTK